MAAVGACYGIAKESFDSIKEIDRRMLATEMCQLLDIDFAGWKWDPRTEAYPGETILPYSGTGKSPAAVEEEFLQNFRELWEAL